MSQERKDIVKAINDSFTRNDLEAFLGHCTENVTWSIIGHDSMTGKDTIRNWMASMGEHAPPSFTIDHLVAEDDTVVCSGMSKMKNEKGVEDDYGYCDIYVFDGDKVTNLNSFVVKIATETDVQAAS